MKRIIEMAAMLVITVLLASVFAGCSAAAGENTTAQTTVASSGDRFELTQINPAEYVELGDYEGIAFIEDGLSVMVGEQFVDVPYRDETFGTEWTLRYYYTQVDPGEDETDWETPTDEDVAKMGIPGVTTFLELKDYVCQKVNENDEIATFMLIGDAVMEQIAADSAYQQIPEAVASACEGVYTDYLDKMLSRCNEIGQLPSVQKDENCVRKVLAAMAIAEKAELDVDAFDYERVLQFLMEQ